MSSVDAPYTSSSANSSSAASRTSSRRTSLDLRVVIDALTCGRHQGGRLLGKRDARARGSSRESRHVTFSLSHRPCFVGHCYDTTRRRNVTVHERDWLAERFQEHRP